MDVYYSNEEIKMAVDTAKKEGLDHFMQNYPRDNRTTITSLSSHPQHKEPAQLTTQKENEHRLSIFDLMMFGFPAKQSTANNHESSFSDKEQETMSKGLEKLTDDCDPCEEVREIVRGIRSGKYQLALTDELSVRSTSNKVHEGREEILKNWTTHKRKKRRPKLTEGFGKHEVIWDGNNMRSVRIHYKL